MTRVLAVCRRLREDHEMLFLTGGDAYDLLSEEYDVSRIPVLKAYFRPGSPHQSLGRTIRKTILPVIDVRHNGHCLDVVCEELEHFGPDLVVSDSEPWTQRAANRLGIPLVSFDHFGVLAYCDWDMPASYRLRTRAAGWAYRALMGRPDKILASAFYPARPLDRRVRVLGSILRDEIMNAKPEVGDHVLFYLAQGKYRFTEGMERALAEIGCEVRIYGAGRREDHDNLSFFGIDKRLFVEDLASCRAVVASAGNQLTSECIYLGKPMLAIPQDAIEQQLNALGVQQMGVGMWTTPEGVSAGLLREFLGNEQRFREATRGRVRDHSAEAADFVARALEVSPGN